MIRRAFVRVLEGAIQALEKTYPYRRPIDSRGVPGGLVYLPWVDYTVIVPDLHARADFLKKVLASRLAGRSGTIEHDLATGRAVVVCVGDALHSEARGKERWKTAYKEFLNGFDPAPAMDEEMEEGLEVLGLAARLQAAYPAHFHFLKGNHENIANERKEGNFPFRKYAYEGDMVREWVLKFAGDEVFDAIYRWEKSLPLAAVGNRFLVVHAEPARVFTPRDIADAYANPEVIAGLTWTDNGQAEPNSVPDTLETFFPGDDESLMFGGHRPVPGRYLLHQGGRYVQINTPNSWVAAVIRRIEDFDPEGDIVDVETRTAVR